MNLLIVDDQVSVVQGLMEQVDWRRYGIDKVYGANSAFEAQQVIRENEIEILLCDIEMPTESGLSLIAWIRREERDIRCILLTAHAKFDYAQESIRLGVCDYILQPASYEKIAAVVERVAQQIRTQGKSREDEKKEAYVLESVAREWLNGEAAEEAVDYFVQQGKLPAESARVYLAVFQILRWTRLDQWTVPLLTAAFGNVVSELFSPFGLASLVVPRRNWEFAVLLWEDSAPVSPSVLAQRLQFFHKLCRQYFHCVTAVYHHPGAPREELALVARRLAEMLQNNVNREAGVFAYSPEKAGEGVYPYRHPEIRRWAQQLGGEHPDFVAREARRILQNMSDTGTLNRRTLQDFYLDFLQAAHTAFGTERSFWDEIMNAPENYEIYRNGMRSVEQMMQLVELFVTHAKERAQEPEGLALRRIDEYIAAHLDEEIRRGDLADYLHHNPDYLNRVFKNATGRSLMEYVVQKKMEAAKTMLLTTSLPVGLIAVKVGYSSFPHFSATYKKVFGVTPLQTRQGKV